MFFSSFQNNVENFLILLKFMAIFEEKATFNKKISNDAMLV